MTAWTDVAPDIREALCGFAVVTRAGASKPRRELAMILGLIHAKNPELRSGRLDGARPNSPHTTQD